ELTVDDDCYSVLLCHFFFQAEDGIRAPLVTGVQTCALPISTPARARPGEGHRPPPRALLSFVVSGLGTQLNRLGKHSVIYGLGEIGRASCRKSTETAL